MPFLSHRPDICAERPVFASILANTLLSTVPGVSGAGPTPEKTLLTPVLDAELIARGEITSMPIRPDTPTGCPTPASITRAVMELTGLSPLFINAGLSHHPTVPCLDLYGSPGGDPRFTDAVPAAGELVRRGEWAGTFLGGYSDLLVLGECVPGGTTTALCVMRALGYDARVSSSYVENPVGIKEEISGQVLARIRSEGITAPGDILRATGDPMMAVATGIAQSYPGTLVLAGGTQMLAVAALLRASGWRPPRIATTCYVRDDQTANFSAMAEAIGTDVTYVDPGFGDLGHAGLARYCIGEVKEGMGAGGAMFLAHILGFSPEEIRQQIFATVSAYR
jgi:uncharacterized protein (TIGR00303 family)